MSVSCMNDCLYRIQEMNIEQHSQCAYDSLTLYEYNPSANGSWPLRDPFTRRAPSGTGRQRRQLRPMGAFCGSMRALSVRTLVQSTRLVTSSNRMLVQFRSDSTVSGTGFSLFFSLTFGMSIILFSKFYLMF